MNLDDLTIKIFADGADLVKMDRQAKSPYIAGFTTNPTLMRKAGMIDYEAFAAVALESCHGKPISFEVIADDFEEMERQARKIARWGDNVYVKVPIANTRGKSATGVIQRLSEDGIKVNVTAVMTEIQVYLANIALANGAPSILSVFAGRIADAGVDPRAMMCKFKGMMVSSAELLWASTREVYNIVEARDSGCQIITVPDNLLSKLSLLNKDLTEFSLETVKQFHDDAVASEYTL